MGPDPRDLICQLQKKTRPGNILFSCARTEKAGAINSRPAVCRQNARLLSFEFYCALVVLYPAQHGTAVQAIRRIEKWHCKTTPWFSLYCPLLPLFPSQDCQSYRKCWTLQLRRTGRWQLSTSWRQQKRATACSSRSWRRRRKGWWWWTVNLSGWTSSSARLCHCRSAGRGLHALQKFFFPILVWSMSHCSSSCMCVSIGGIFPLCYFGKCKVI